MCIFADDTWDSAAFLGLVGRRWALVSMGPSKLNTILRELQDSPEYANLLEKPKGWVAPSAVAPLSQLADRLPGNASAATSAEGPGKGGMGGRGPATGKRLNKADRGGKADRGSRGTGKKPGAGAGDDGE